MGETTAHMMTLRLSLLVALAIVSCHGLPTTNQVVPEGSNLVAEHHAKFNKLIPTEFIAAMTKSGNTAGDCRTFAETSKTDVTNTVASLQSTLNAVDTGAGCANEGQTAVTTATTALTNANAAVVTAQAGVVTAQAAQTTACTAVVTLRALPLDALEAELAAGCAAAEGFITGVASTGYTTVKAACTQATTALTAAQATVVTNQATLDTAVKTAANLKNACLCRVKMEQATAWEAAGTASAAHAVEWKKSHEVICALDQTTSCTVPTCPAVTQPQVAAGVADASCQIHITGMDQMSNGRCSAVEMDPQSGDDGGVVFMGGPAGTPDAGRVMYEGDVNTLGMAVPLTHVNTATTTGNGFGSILSELKENKVYRLMQGAGVTMQSATNTVTSVSPVAYLQCLTQGIRTPPGVRSVALPAGLTMSGDKYNIFAGMATAAFKDVNNHWQLIELNDCESTPTVTDLGLDTGSGLANMYGCERDRQNGILEQGAAGMGGAYSIMYACGSGNFCRKSLPSGNSATVFALGGTYHSDTCSITVDLSTQRYFWHSESTNGMSEPMYTCPLTFGGAESATSF